MKQNTKHPQANDIFVWLFLTTKKMKQPLHDQTLLFFLCGLERERERYQQQQQQQNQSLKPTIKKNSFIYLFILFWSYDHFDMVTNLKPRYITLRS